MVSPRVIGLKGEIIFPRQYNVDDGDVNIVNLVAGSSDHQRVSFVTACCKILLNSRFFLESYFFRESVGISR